MTRTEKAKHLFEDLGFNCAQAVAGAFADELSLSEDMLLRLSSAFGGGFGRMREMCGAVSGMTIVFGALYGFGTEQGSFDKATLYEVERELISEFSKEIGSFLCRDILGADKATVGGTPSERTQKFYNERPCTKCVMTAVSILDDFISSQKNGTK